MRGLRLLILALAIGCGLGAVALVQAELERARQASAVPASPGLASDEPQEAPKVDVLVAERELRMGEIVQPDALRWQAWPAEAVSEFYITRDMRPDALEDEVKQLAGARIFSGEPITDDKLLQLDNPGVLSAMLRSGMRAVAVQISPETGAGGFILPGDYVDVVLTREIEVLQGSARSLRKKVANTLLSSVRVLAIDQFFAQGDGGATEVGRTATLEVTPAQAENLALAEQSGQLSLALRGLSELVRASGASSDKPLPEPVPETLFDLRDGQFSDGQDSEENADGREIVVVRGSSKIRMTVE
ncbi:MAG: Flp pilus assembly protein CpaB [Rhodobacteraceae bacterium]|nr:Flp pilus assembly protein CpaB [Paracoccaceae bacterium]